MELKKINGMENLIQPTQTGVKNPAASIGPSFRDTLDKATTKGPGAPAAPPTAVPTAPAAVASKANVEPVKFSNHAVERMQLRGISFKPEDMTRLNDAIARAAAKGSKDSLILMNDSALIVSVKNKTVVTVMDKNALKENVFTNIDSTIVM